MLECPVVLPAEARAQKMSLELMCFLAQKMDQLQATVQAMYDDHLLLKAQALEILEQHREAAETYFATLPDPCGEEPFERCPFLELPEGTKRRDLDRGAFVFILPDSTIFRVLGDSVQAVLPEGAIEDLLADEEYRLHTSDGRTFQLDPDCPNCPQPPGGQPEEPELPEIPPDPAKCEEP